MPKDDKLNDDVFAAVSKMPEEQQLLFNSMIGGHTQLVQTRPDVLNALVAAAMELGRAQGSNIILTPGGDDQKRWL